MQFSDSSTKQGLIEDITFLTGMDTTAYATADRTRNINRWYYNVFAAILEVEGGWEFDDTDKTDLPVLTTNMVASQQDYELPKSVTTNPTTLQGGATSGAIMKIHRVEVKDANGLWVKLKQLDQREVKGALTEYKKTPGMPSEYDVRGGSLFLFCPPAAANTTLTAGLKIYIAREVYTFLASDTTREPGFAEPYHRVLSLGAAFDWFTAKMQPDRAAMVKGQIDELMADLKRFYGRRNADKVPRLNPRLVNRIVR